MTSITAPPLYSREVLIPTTVGITLAAMFSGGNIALSYIAFPALLLPKPETAATPPQSDKSRSTAVGPKPATSTGLLARQWQKIYNIGVLFGSSSSSAATASFILAMTQLPRSLATQRYFLLAAGLVTFMIGPYTFLIIKPTNDILHARANAATTGTSEGEDKGHPGSMTSKQKGNETDELMRRWAQLNVVRAMMPLTGAVLAATALLWQ